MARKNVSKLKSAIREALDKQGGRHSIPLGVRSDGKAIKGGKVSAKRAPEAVEGLGLALCKAMEAEQTTTRSTLVAILRENPETMLLAEQEIEGYRDTKVEALGKSMTDKREGRSIQANFQRPITILKYCAKVVQDGGSITHITAEKSLNRMYALCTKKKRGHKATPKPMTQESFESYREQLSRVVPPLTKDATEGEIAKHQAGLLRLETMFRAVVAELAKHEHETAIPVSEVVQISKGIKRAGKTRIKRAA